MTKSSKIALRVLSCFCLLPFRYIVVFCVLSLRRIYCGNSKPIFNSDSLLSHCWLRASWEREYCLWHQQWANGLFYPSWIDWSNNKIIPYTFHACQLSKTWILLRWQYPGEKVWRYRQKQPTPTNSMSSKWRIYCTCTACTMYLKVQKNIKVGLFPPNCQNPDASLKFLIGPNTQYWDSSRLSIL